MDEIYHEGNHDFLYISHVSSKNKHSYNRMKWDYNFLGTPTVWFDGGEIVELGGYVGNKQDYIDTINVCCLRDVHDLKLEVEVHWLGNAAMDITVRIENIDASPDDYGGYLKVYVTEIESSLGWDDTTGKPYQFPFLDYAFDETVSIAANGGVWQKTTNWDGTRKSNGYGVSFGSITRDNVAVFAVVYDDEWHQGYSYPPASNPFDAYYVDEAEVGFPLSLYADADTIPQAGGVVNFTLDAGLENANRNYYLLGSVSGIEPGLPLPGGMVTLPLVWDAFTELILKLANSPALPGFHSTLDAAGTSTAQLDTLGPVPPTSVGLVMHYAYLLYYPLIYYPYDFVSCPCSITIIP